MVQGLPSDARSSALEGTFHRASSHRTSSINIYCPDYHCLNNVMYRGGTRQNYMILLHFFDGSELDITFLTGQIQ